jgi:chorismate mutase/prephenate dehydratase
MNIKPNIYVLGPEGTNGHQVALGVQRYYGYGTIVFTESHEEIFERVSSGLDSDCGVVPIENSTEGLVSDVIDYWRNNKKTPVQVIREYSLPVHHHILVRENVDIENVKEIFSRSEALRQCKNALALHGFKTRSVYSTAQAAKIVSMSRKNIGVIGSEFLACCYGLQVAISNVQDYESNTTRFHMISKCERVHDGEGRTAVMFSIKNSVGNLFRVLNLFNESGINISTIQSFPTRKKDRKDFYCEIDCYESRLPMIHRIRECTEQYRLIGSFDIHVIKV